MAMDSWIEQGMYIFKGDGTKIIFILRLRIFLFFYFFIFPIYDIVQSTTSFKILNLMLH